MSQQNSSNNNNNAAPAVSWGTKAGYIGTGILIGLIAYPFVRKMLSKAQPKLDGMLDELTGKVESLAEGASDLMARAREAMSREGSEKS